MNRALFLGVLIMLMLMSVQAFAAQWYNWESFERGATQWTTDGEGGLIDGRISGDVGSDGDFAFGGRVVVREVLPSTKAGFFIEPGVDFTKVNGLAMDLFIGTRIGWTMTLVFQSGGSWHWSESEKRQLKPGWNRNLVFNLADTNFGGKGPIQFKEDIKKIQILLVPPRPTQGAIYLDNLRLAGAGAARLSPTRLPNTQIQLIDDFEHGQTRWLAVGGSASKVAWTNSRVSQGEGALLLETNASSPSQTGIFGIEDNFDFNAVQSLVMDIYNESPSAIVSLMMACGDDWEHLESPSAKLKEGWNYNVAFDLQAAHFKSEKSGWKYTVRVPGMAAKRLGLIFTTGEYGKGGLVIDNMRVRSQTGADLSAFSPPEQATGLETQWLAFEAGSPFQPYLASSALGSAPASSYVSGGRKSLRLDYLTRHGGDKAEYIYGEKMDLKGVKALVFDAYNPMDGSVEIALGVKVGDDYRWYGARSQRLAPGWNKGVRIGLEGAVFQAAETNWQYSASLNERSAEDIQSVVLVVTVPRAERGSVYLGPVSMIRRPDLNRWKVPVTFNGSYETKVEYSAYKYEAWAPGSFETDLTGWQGKNGGGMDLSVIGLSSIGVSKGKQSMRIQTRGTGNNKAGVVFDKSAGAVLPDLSTRSRIRMDVYNPGRPAAVGMAFVVGAGNQWVESSPVLIKSGWNRNVTFDLDATAWKFAAGSTVTEGQTNTWSAFPASLRTAAMLNQMFLLIHKVTRGDYYVDNIRLGTDEGLGAATETEAQVNLGATLYAGRYLDVKGSLEVGHSADAEPWLEAATARATARLGGHRLSLFYGEALTAFDDITQIMTGKVGVSTGLNDYSKTANTGLAGVEHDSAFDLFKIRTFAALPWESNRWTPGGSLLAGLRATSPIPGGGRLGASWVNYRTGYDAGSGYYNGEVEQSMQLVGADIRLVFPFGFSVEAGGSQTIYATDETLSVLFDSRGIPALYREPHSTENQRWVAKASASAGPVNLEADFRNTGVGFSNSLSDGINPGAREMIGSITLKTQGWFPGTDFESMSGGLLKGSQIGLQVEKYESLKDTFNRTGFRLRLENDRTTALNYRVIYENKTEGNRIDPLVAGSVDTSNKINDIKLIFGIRPFEKTGLSAGGYIRTFSPSDPNGVKLTNQSVFGELAQKLWRGGELSVTGLYVNTSAPGFSETAAATYFVLTQKATSWLSAELYYGAPLFSGDEFAVAWWDPVKILGLKVSGSF